MMDDRVEGIAQRFGKNLPLNERAELYKQLRQLVSDVKQETHDRTWDQAWSEGYNEGLSDAENASPE